MFKDLLLQHGRCTYEFTVVVVTEFKRPCEDQVRENPSIEEGSYHKILPIPEKLSAISAGRRIISFLQGCRC